MLHVSAQGADLPSQGAGRVIAVARQLHGGWRGVWGVGEEDAARNEGAKRFLEVPRGSRGSKGFKRFQGG